MENINDFQQLSKRTAPTKGHKENLINFSVSTCEEAGELLGVLKKYLFHDNPINKEKLIGEMGDLLWYLCNIATEFEIDMSEILEFNINKLWTRYPNGFNPEDSFKRVDVKNGENK